MAIRALLLDFFGVLAHIPDRPTQHMLEEERGWKKGEIEQISVTLLRSPYYQDATVGRVPAEVIWQDVAHTLYGDATRWKALNDAYFSVHQINETLVKYIRSLHQDCKIAILSNAFSDARTFISGQFGLAEVCDTIIISAEEGIAKPERRLYRSAMERLHVSPEETLYVDDTLLYTRLLKSIGMFTVCFQNNEQALTDMQRYIALSQGE